MDSEITEIRNCNAKVQIEGAEGRERILAATKREGADAGDLLAARQAAVEALMPARSNRKYLPEFTLTIGQI
jgi:hypothetical protein